MNSRLFWIFAPPSGVELFSFAKKQNKALPLHRQFPHHPTIRCRIGLHFEPSAPSVSLDSNLFLAWSRQAYDRRYETIRRIPSLIYEGSNVDDSSLEDIAKKCTALTLYCFHVYIWCPRQTCTIDPSTCRYFGPLVRFMSLFLPFLHSDQQQEYRVSGTVET